MGDARRPLLRRRVILGGAEETTIGTAETVSAAMDGAFYNVQMSAGDFFGDTRRTPDGHYLGHADAPAGKRPGRLTFEMELRHGDAFVAFLTGCGLVLDTGAYVPRSSMALRKTWTFVSWEDGRKKTLYGASGNVVIRGTNGGKVMAEFTWEGIWGGTADEAMPARTVIQSAPYLLQAITATLGGSSIPHFSQFTMDLGNEVVEREDVTAASGIGNFEIVEREPTVTLDPEARLVADYDSYGLLTAGTTAALNVVLTTGSDTLTIAAPRAQRISVEDGERGKRRTDGITLILNADSGDDEFSITQSV